MKTDSHDAPRSESTFNLKLNYNMTFSNETGQVGVLDFNGPAMLFFGNAEESAKVFFDWIAKNFASRLEQERQYAVSETERMSAPSATGAIPQYKQFAQSLRNGDLFEEPVSWPNVSEQIHMAADTIDALCAMCAAAPAPAQPVAWMLHDEGLNGSIPCSRTKPISTKDWRQVCYYQPADSKGTAARVEEGAPLQTSAVGGGISIVLGAKTLAHATEVNPEFWDAAQDQGKYRVVNADEFALEVLRQLKDEDEQGNTMVTRMLDAAITKAIENGAEGVEEAPCAPDMKGEQRG